MIQYGQSQTSCKYPLQGYLIERNHENILEGQKLSYNDDDDYYSKLMGTINVHARSGFVCTHRYLGARLPRHSFLCILLILLIFAENLLYSLFKGS